MSKTKMGKNKNKDTTKLVKKQSFFRKSYIFLAIIIGYAAYYVMNLNKPVPMPEMDLNAYWGTYPIDPKADTSVRPFKIEFSDVMINDLRERLLHRRPFVPPLDHSGFTYGFNSEFLTKVLDFWQNKYNFKEREDFFNKYNHFTTNIQGLDLHFIHVKPNVDKDIAVIPLLMMHGWPGSIREFYEIIPMLTTPRPGYNFVFEVIVPSLPGYGFSQAASRPGLGANQMAVVLRNLMLRLGFKQFYIQGGDWGNAIGSAMATLFQDNVLGFHSNMPTVSFSLKYWVLSFLGSFWPSLIVEPEVQDRMYPISEKLFFLIEEFGYMHLQATKPDTVGTALTDSPAGLAAYILEKFSTWTNPAYRKAMDGELLKKYTLTNLLDNVMVYWMTNSITTSMRLYAETLNKEHMGMQVDKIPTPVPTWGIKFKHELSYSPDFLLRDKYTNYLGSTIVNDDGGHFAAFEYPDILSKDIFKAVGEFNKFHYERNPPTEDPKTIYDFSVTDIHGNQVKLDKYKNYVLIIVNVASQCGLTEKNYNQLNQLYEKYFNKGLRILAFPCNQFGGQEPGNTEDIINFIKAKNVKFDVFNKIDVNGENTDALWQFLKLTQSGTFGDFVKWNFSKFIIDRNGLPVERFAPNVDPVDLEEYLVKYL